MPRLFIGGCCSSYAYEAALSMIEVESEVLAPLPYASSHSAEEVGLGQAVACGEILLSGLSCTHIVPDHIDSGYGHNAKQTCHSLSDLLCLFKCIH